MGSRPLRRAVLGAVALLAFCTLPAGARAPSTPYGESNSFALDTNRIGSGESDLLIVTAAGPDVPPLPALLGPAIPNPFNPRTQISFRVPEAGEVALGIYDLRGRRVRALLRTELDAGRHERIWNGRSDDGHVVAAGVYLVRLETPSVIETRKVSLVK